MFHSKPPLNIEKNFRLRYFSFTHYRNKEKFMTDNQLREIFDKLTKCVNGIQLLQDGQTKLEAGQTKLEAGQAKLEAGQDELKADVAEIKRDVSELKAGQKRLELGQETINRSLDILAGDSLRVKSRVGILEERIN